MKDKLYEIVPRVRSGLPLPPTDTTNELSAGILGRTQRDSKVTLCNFVMMNNHGHYQAIPKEPAAFPGFYREIQKKTTDTLRALLGLKSLRMWEDRTSVIMIDGLQDAIKRLIYIFNNPVSANLVESIDDFPGLSSWKAFTSCKPSIDASFEMKVKWYPVTTIPELPKSRILTPEVDRDFVKHLNNSTEVVEHVLEIKPFAWLELFGITDAKEIEDIRQSIIQGVRDHEASCKALRLKEGKSVIGIEKLKTQRYMQAHTPKKNENKIFLICTDKERRIKLIALFKETFALCQECYQKIKLGIQVTWPPGTFVPWLPPTECMEDICL